MDLNCIIDTMQISIEINNLIDMTEVTKDNFGYITEIRDAITKDGAFKVLKISLNKFKGYKLINGLREYQNLLEVAMKEIGVIDTDKVKIDRIDIAIDSPIDYKENFKYLLFLFEVVNFSDEKSDRWYTINLKNLKNNTMLLKNRSMEVCFYDKKEESNSHHIYNTRLEWRFKRISNKDLKVHIDKLIDRLRNIDNNIEPLEFNMSKRLIALWNEEKEEIQSFSEFVRKYNNYFYTANIVKMVYAESGLKGNYKCWIKKFRENNNEITLYVKADINKFKKDMIKSIKEYKKN